MMQYGLKQITGLLIVILGTGFLTFFLFSLAPGDRALAIANARHGGEGNVDSSTVEQIRIEEGLDQTFWVQFGDWLWKAAHLDFGNSLVSGADVASIFFEEFAHTVPLATLAFAFALCLSIPLAIVAVLNPGGWIDKCSIALASLGASVPHFWLGLLLIYFFASELNWLPAYGSGSAQHLILPALTLGTGMLAILTRFLRASLLEAQKAAFIEALELRGISDWEIFFRHVFHHSMIPFVTILGVEFAILLEGAVVVEVTFARNGVGSLLVHAIRSRDYPVVQFIVLFTAVIYVLFNFVVDLSYRFLDPRLRRGMDV